jgi:hypothetical protein
MSKTGPVVVFGKSKRDSFEDQKNYPGPGQYQSVNTESSLKYGFPHEPKFKQLND